MADDTKLPGERFNIEVEFKLNPDGTVNLSFLNIHPEDLGDLFASIGTEEFQIDLADQVLASFAAQRTTGEETPDGHDR